LAVDAKQLLGDIKTPIAHPKFAAEAAGPLLGQANGFGLAVWTASGNLAVVTAGKQLVLRLSVLATHHLPVAPCQGIAGNHYPTLWLPKVGRGRGEQIDRGCNSDGDSKR